MHTAQLHDLLLEIPYVRLAWLFGSRARGRARPDSDYDVAVLLDEETAQKERGRVVRDLAGALGRAVPSHLLDIVVLNDAPVLLRHRVLQGGVLLLERLPIDRIRFVTKTLREYQDGEIRRRDSLRIQPSS